MSKFQLAITRVQHLDLDWCIRLNQYSAQRKIANFFKGVSRLGDGWFWYICLATTWMVRGLGYALELVYMCLGTLCGTIFYKFLKRKTVRPRPYQVHQAVVLGERPLDHFSFPSGHTMHAVIATILIGTALPVLLWIMLPFTALIAVSRVILGLHYPTDVLAGAVIGSVLGATIIYSASLFSLVI
jgi:undecaprenyl-diphosphatase